MNNRQDLNYFNIKKIKNIVKHFLIGRFFTGAAGFLSTLLIARNLDISAYAAYVVMLGLSIVAGKLSSLSLQTAAHRFIPETIALGQHRLQVNITTWIVVIRFLSALFTVGLILILLPKIASFFSIVEWIPELKIWTIALYCSNLFRFIGKVLQSFLLQKILKWITIGVALVRLLWLCYFINIVEQFSLMNLVIMEAVVYGAGIAVSLLFLFWHLQNINAQHAQEKESNPGDLIKRMTRYAFFDYIRNLVLLFSGRAANRLIIAKLLGPVQIASFGFAQNLNETAKRYLPSGLLRNMIQPVLMGR